MRASVMTKEFSPFLLYAFAFFMLWEWLRPLGQLTNTDQLGIFIFFLVIAFLGAYFGMNRILLSCIKGVYILGAIYSFYFSGGFFHFKWWKSFAKIISENIGFIMDSNWNEMTNEFRTLLFFILLWLIVYLIQYWLLNRQRIFIFFFMTIIYITVLDTFTPYDGKGAIVRTVIAGFTVMGMLTFYRLLKRENIEKEPSFTRKWMVPLAGMIVVSTAAGFAAPKAAPMSPIPFLLLSH
ncbi:hypothetical protein RCG23_10175 [Neobacillus sp. PS3-34]|uniref:hypothetical protein n=1 Tax=Neobacillus sp. PS3-34 TaxID=3070678 RepID=UPI0027E0365F|nr:hypothetical protein [Neobacillus sp. PS3-34]WML50152.1 hypothetical protein RCG23_10175 [Neobacillus sp. PS3-34]